SRAPSHPPAILFQRSPFPPPPDASRTSIPPHSLSSTVQPTSDTPLAFPPEASSTPTNRIHSTAHKAAPPPPPTPPPPPPCPCCSSPPQAQTPASPPFPPTAVVPAASPGSLLFSNPSTYSIEPQLPPPP